MNPLTHPLFDSATTLGVVLLHSLWQITLLAGVYYVLISLRPSLSPQRRHLMGMVLMLAIPAAAFATWALHTAPHAPAVAAVEAVDPLEVYRLTVDAPDATLLERLQAQLPLLSLAWFVGVLVLLTRTLLGLRETQRLKRSAEPLPAHIASRLAALAQKARLKHLPQVYASTEVTLPTVVGLIKPVILLPLGIWAGLSPDQLDAVLLHEMAHIRRGDAWANLAQRIVEALFFYHPLVWWLSSQIREEREFCCDDSALLFAADRMQYARTLLQVAEQSQGVPAHALAFIPRREKLLGRVQRLFNANKPQDRILPISRGLVLAMIGGLVLAGFVTLKAQTAPIEPPAPATPALADTPEATVAALSLPADEGAADSYPDQDVFAARQDTLKRNSLSSLQNWTIQWDPEFWALLDTNRRKKMTDAELNAKLKEDMERFNREMSVLSEELSRLSQQQVEVAMEQARRALREAERQQDIDWEEAEREALEEAREALREAAEAQREALEEARRELRDMQRQDRDEEARVRVMVDGNRYQVVPFERERGRKQDRDRRYNEAESRRFEAERARRNAERARRNNEFHREHERNMQEFSARMRVYGDSMRSFGLKMSAWGKMMKEKSEAFQAKLLSNLVADGIIKEGEKPSISISSTRTLVNGKAIPDNLQEKYRKLYLEFRESMGMDDDNGRSEFRFNSDEDTPEPPMPPAAASPRAPKAPRATPTPPTPPAAPKASSPRRWD